MKNFFICLAIVFCIAAVIFLSRSHKNIGPGAPKSDKAMKASQKALPADTSSKSKEYFIQVANCFYESCKTMYVELLRAEKQPVIQEISYEIQDVYKLTSGRAYDFESLNKLIDKIGERYEFLDISFVKQNKEAYKIYIGEFGDFRKAEVYKAKIEELFPGADLSLRPESSSKKHLISKVLAGPYSSGYKAKIALGKLRKNKKFRGAFLVYF